LTISPNALEFVSSFNFISTMKFDRQVPLHTITDLEALRVLADPLRNHILEILIKDPLPVKQIAGRLGLAPNKLYYHVNLMEQHGLIEIVDTRMVSGIVEKHYRAVALNYEVDPELLSPTTEAGRESIDTALTGTLDATRDDIRRSLEARYFDLDHGAEPKPRKMMVTRHAKRLPEAEANRFLRRLRKLAKEFEEAPEPEPDAQTFALTIAYYPSFYFAEDEHADES
jgi:DNA-binding transcriptional ArsR family regulator